MNIFKRIWQALKEEEEIDRQRQNRLMEVNKVLEAFHSNENYHYDDIDTSSSPQDTNHRT